MYHFPLQNASEIFIKFFGWRFAGLTVVTTELLGG
jgi:hypothetical protein